MKTINFLTITLFALIFAVSYSSGIYGEEINTNCNCSNEQCTQAGSCNESHGTAEGNISCSKDKCTNEKCKESCDKGNCSSANMNMNNLNSSGGDKSLVNNNMSLSDTECTDLCNTDKSKDCGK
jgi:hypothetical protein